MSDPDFTSLLKRSTSDIKRPWAFPAGTYTLEVLGYEFGKSEKKETPRCRYKFHVTGFDQDVDPADLADKDWTKKELRDDFYLTENAMFRLVDFLEACGVNTAGRQLDELVPEAVGRTVKVAMIQTPNQKNPEAAGYNEIQTYLKP